ncbi:MAG: hypothetical protein HOK50_08060 [Kordiimonadaceae bacterium]|nr:hypothetical protein [Kordiimonadaceae bacterium]
MLIIIIAIFITLSIIIKSYKRIDDVNVTSSDVIKATFLATIAISFLVLRNLYFALPEEGMVTNEYLNYRKILLWGFIALMGYIFRAIIYSLVYFYRNRG